MRTPLLFLIAHCTAGVCAVTYTVNTNSDAVAGAGTAGSLRYVMQQILFNEVDPDITVNLNAGLGTITLTEHLPILSTPQVPTATPTTVAINGNGNSINGADNYQAFFIVPLGGYAAKTSSLAVTIDSLNIDDCV